MVKQFLLPLALILFAFNANSQGTISDYKRAFALRDSLKNKVFYADVQAQWIGSTHKFWYVRQTPQGSFYVVTDARQKKRSDLFDHEKLATALSKSSGRPVKASNLGLRLLQVNATVDTFKFVYNNTNWQYNLRNNQLINQGKRVDAKDRYWAEMDEERTGEPVVSPNGKLSAFIRNSNIFVKDVATGKERALSINGAPGEYYSARIRWSPDSKKVAAMKIRPAEKQHFYFVESSPTDQLQPKLHKREYFKPGDALPFRVPCIFNVETGEAITPSTDLFNSQYDVRRLDWRSDSQALLFEYNQRGHQVFRVLELSAQTGNVRVIINETSPTFVNYSRYYRKDLNKSNEIIWMSERDNWNHLYLYDYATGNVKNQITKGQWYVREVVHVDENKRTILFNANGMEPNQDPYLVRYYMINFDGTGLTCLTPEEGMHQAVFSADMQYFVDVYSMVNVAPVAKLRSAINGNVLMTLEYADISQLLNTGWKAPEPFVAKGRDGVTDIWGVIIKPSNFDANKKYPVLEYIYAGPGSHYVPKTFNPFYWSMSGIAELGFIVVQIDGMGTSFRSKSFEDVIHNNLKDAGFADRIAWTKAAAQKYPYMDIDRVGIFGASAGGQEAMSAVLFHPQHYKAAYAACGCHDNRMDKIWWNEQWMGYPIGSHYVESSNVANAHLLTRPLMLLVGELDDNVDPASTMQVANALIKAKKDFELVVLPGVGHTLGGDFGEHKRYDFFVRHLLEVNPPKWDNF